MNKAQKKSLLEAASEIANARQTIEDVRDELQSDFDEKSEKWQESEKGEDAKEEIGRLNDIIDALDGAETDIDYEVTE